MGLCKCSKKKVTNLFCFEHTVNVCEHCLVANHSKCIVQSYLQWLQDSDYDPTCRLCGKNLSDESCDPCIRLTCYDLFHWSCFDKYQHSLPANTAPAGYTCPMCNSCIFPNSNVVSPIVDALKEKLATVNWARTGLGLPQIEEKIERFVAPLQSLNLTNESALTSNNSSKSQMAVGGNFHSSQGQANTTKQSVIAMDETIPYARVLDRSEYTTGPHDPHSLLNSDPDIDKYKRRSALQWFSRWFNSNLSSGSIRAGYRRDPNLKHNRFLILLFILVVGFITVVIVLARLGRWSTEGDPLFDPFANPNIRIQSDQ